MNKSTTKKWLKIGIIALALLLTIALGIGASAAWYTAKRQATGTILMNSGIEIQYKGFGQTDPTTWTKENNKLEGVLLTKTEVVPGDTITVTDSDVRLTKESVDAYLRVNVSYKFYATKDATTAYTDEELTAAKEGFTSSELITMSKNFFGANFVKNGDYYYTQQKMPPMQQSCKKLVTQLTIQTQQQDLLDFSQQALHSKLKDQNLLVLMKAKAKVMLSKLQLWAVKMEKLLLKKQ